MLNKLAIVFLTLFVSNAYGAFAVLLENPPVKYFSSKNGVPMKVAHEIIIDAVDRASSPRHEYSIYSDEPGHVVAKIFVNNKHTALVNIRYTKHKIEVTYNSSQVLKYSKSSDGEFIHPRYMQWVSYLMTKLSYVSRKIGKVTLVDVSPDVLEKIKAGEGKRIGVFAYGIYYKNTDVTSIRNTTEFSAAVSAQLKKKMLSTSKIALQVVVIPQNEAAQDFLTSSEQKNDGQQFCNTYNVDELVIADIDDSTGGGSREVKMMNYNCKTKEIKSDYYYIEKRIIERFPFQIEIDKVLVEFLDANGILSLE